MSTVYDSTKIRQLASQVGRIAESVSHVGSRTLRPVRNEIPNNLVGKAGTALDESVGALMTDVNSISGQLTGIQRALNTLAEQLEEVDREAKNLIISR